MKIDKKTIDTLLNLNDDQLWSVFKMFLSKSGYDSMKKLERPKDMSVLRDTLAKLSDSDIERAIELLKGKSNG